VALTVESKHHLHTQLEKIMDKEASVTMMEAIPPFDWSEVALKKDIDATFATTFASHRAEINESIAQLTINLHKDMNSLSNRMVTWMITMNSATAAIIAAIVIFAK
jgi:disulfide bond formation protein DsbB